MGKSEARDIKNLHAIIKSITNIKKAFEQGDINNARNLKNDEIVQAACTQFITNIFEAKENRDSGLREETYCKLNELNRIKLRGARQIASHDYDNVDLYVIYDICMKLTRATVLSEIYGALAELEKPDEGVQDD